MGGKGKEVEDAKDWTKENEALFIQLLVAKKRKGKLQSSTFKKEIWLEINDELLNTSGENYGIEILKEKFNRLCVKYRQFSELIGHIGVKWDMTTNVDSAPHETWEAFFKKSKDFKMFKKSGCTDYELLGEIFDAIVATGKLQQLSTEDSLSDSQERHLEEEFLSGSMHVDLEPENSEVGADGKSQKRSMDSSERRHGKASKMDKMDSFLEKWTATLSAKEEVYKAKAERYRSSSSGSSTSDPFSVSVCMSILESMEGVSTTTYNKAIEKFLSVE